MPGLIKACKIQTLDFRASKAKIFKHRFYRFDTFFSMFRFLGFSFTGQWSQGRSRWKRWIRCVRCVQWQRWSPRWRIGRRAPLHSAIPLDPKGDHLTKEDKEDRIFQKKKLKNTKTSFYFIFLENVPTSPSTQSMAASQDQNYIAQTCSNSWLREERCTNAVYVQYWFSLRCVPNVSRCSCTLWAPGGDGLIAKVHHSWQRHRDNLREFVVKTLRGKKDELRRTWRKLGHVQHVLLKCLKHLEASWSAWTLCRDTATAPRVIAQEVQIRPIDKERPQTMVAPLRWSRKHSSGDNNLHTFVRGLPTWPRL